MKVYARIKSKMIVDCAIAAVKSKLKFPPSSRVSPTVVPPLHKFEGTHDVRSAWGNTRCSHR